MPGSGVDVVIAAHQAASTIGDAVASARAQTLSPARVTVVADACADATAELARRAGADVIEIAARSAARARNAGAGRGTSAWIAFLDADDLWEPGWLEAAVTRARVAPGAAVVYGAVWQWTPEDGRFVTDTTPAEGNVFDRLLTGPLVVTSATLVARAAFEQADGFDERFRAAGVEDLDLWLRLAATHAFAHVPARLAVYRRFPGGAMRDVERFATIRRETLEVIARAVAARPAAAGTVRRARAWAFVASAQRHLAHGLARRARAEAIRALAQHVTSRTAWALLASSCLPRRLRAAVIRLRRRARGRARAR